MQLLCRNLGGAPGHRIDGTQGLGSHEVADHKYRYHNEWQADAEHRYHLQKLTPKRFFTYSEPDKYGFASGHVMGTRHHSDPHARWEPRRDSLSMRAGRLASRDLP